MTRTVREATTDFLRCAGITTIFGNPGSTELPLFRQFPEDFDYVLGLQESIALAMADGYAQATRRAAFVNLHSSVGVGHALGNLFTSYRNQTPLVVAAGQQARSILPFEPFLFAQDAAQFPRPFVKWSCEPARAEDVPGAIARAYYIAMEPPCGPTFVSIPADDWERPCDPVTLRAIAARNPGDPAALAAIANALIRAERPAIVAGAGVARDEAWIELIALAECLAAHVWVAPFSGRNSFPEDHRLFAGFLEASREKIVDALSTYDVVLVMGGPLSLYHTESTGPHVPPACQVFHVVDRHAFASWAPVGNAVVADAKLALASLLDLLQSDGRGRIKRSSEAGANESAADYSLARRPPPLSATRLTDRYLCQQIAALRPQGAVIVEEAPSTRTPMHDHLPMLERDTFYTCASGGLGFGLPAAVGISLARPRDKVIALLGDGSAMYSIQGLWSAAQLKRPVSFIIVRNGGYEALVRFGPQFGLHDVVGSKLPEIDFCALARGQGVDATRVEDCARLDEALRHSFSAPRPTLVEVVVQ